MFCKSANQSRLLEFRFRIRMCATLTLVVNGRVRQSRGNVSGQPKCFIGLFISGLALNSDKVQS
jgi:hypothetical protein